MFKKRKKTLVLLACMFFILAACSSNADSSSRDSEILEKGKTYYGKNATHEIIEVDSETTWTIKSDKKDDTDYSVVNVNETGEEIAGYPVIELVAEEVIGDIESRFAKREGRKFIVVSDETSVYFRSVAEENKDEIRDDLNNSDDKDRHVMDIANYIFNKP